MFSQKLGSSADSTVQKLGAMFISLCSHILVLAVMVGLSLLVSKVVLVEANGSGVSLTFGPPPGDPRQPKPDTMHTPHFGTVQIDPNTSSKIHLEQLEHGDVADVLPVLVLLGPVSIPHGPDRPYGPCGCMNPYKPVDPNPSKTQPQKLPFLERSSWLHQAVLVRKVDPEYPMFAKRAGIQGAVVVHALIDREGAVRNISVVSGPQQLRGAAVDAIRQWRYQPYVLNGITVDVATTITVDFVLSDKNVRFL